MNPLPRDRASRIFRYAGPMLSLLLGCSLAHAQVVIFSGKHYSNLPVPDNSVVGVADEQSVSGLLGEIFSVTAHLFVSASGPDPMFNGDLYVALAHNSEQAVLLNRVGRRAGASVGYGDSGFDVTFSDAAPADIHDYRLTLNGSHSIPLSSGGPPQALTGTWQPDGRNIDPEAVTSGSPRTANLSVFSGGDPNGTWTLLLADFSPGGLARLDSWTLELTAVPEPMETSLAFALLLLLGAFLRKRPAGPGKS